MATPTLCSSLLITRGPPSSSSTFMCPPLRHDHRRRTTMSLRVVAGPLQKFTSWLVKKVAPPEPLVVGGAMEKYDNKKEEMLDREKELRRTLSERYYAMERACSGGKHNFNDKGCAAACHAWEDTHYAMQLVKFEIAAYDRAELMNAELKVNSDLLGIIREIKNLRSDNSLPSSSPKKDD